VLTPDAWNRRPTLGRVARDRGLAPAGVIPSTTPPAFRARSTGRRRPRIPISHAGTTSSQGGQSKRAKRGAAPPAPEAPQVGRVDPPVRVGDDRHLADPQAPERGLRDHLWQLQPVGGQPELFTLIPAERPARVAISRPVHHSGGAAATALSGPGGFPAQWLGVPGATSTGTARQAGPDRSRTPLPRVPCLNEVSIPRLAPPSSGAVVAPCGVAPAAGATPTRAADGAVCATDAAPRGRADVHGGAIRVGRPHPPPDSDDSAVGL
jgi:hypothetical protein